MQGQSEQEAKAKFDAYCDELYNRGQAQRRERYAKNRKKRPEGARVHRKIEEYEEGKALVELMKKFVKESFLATHDGYVQVNTMAAAFEELKPGMTTLEKNLFQRHLKKLILQHWTSARYVVYKKQRCYCGLEFKKK